MDRETEAGERYFHHAHAPAHLFRSGATYFLTAKTLHGQPVMAFAPRRSALVDALSYACERRGWVLVAWVVLPNHYHCILLAPDSGEPNLAGLVGSVHRFTAVNWNREDRAPGRTVWYQYWDTCLTSVGAFHARLNYLHHNPVKHGYAESADAYPFSSYERWRQIEEVDLEGLEQAYPWDRSVLE